ncbi:MAG: hypothetical protein WC586_12790 [Methanoregula sp.]
MKKINLSKLIGLVIGLSLVLACSAAAMDSQDSKVLLSDKLVVTAAKENIQKFTGSDADAINGITLMKTYVGDVYQVTTEADNVYNINVKTGQVETAMIQADPDYSVKGKDISSMEKVAEAFVEKHYTNFKDKKMTLVASKVIDHGGIGKEYVYSWNEKSGNAYTLSFASVSFFPDDNRVYYHGTDRELLVDTLPKVSQVDAQKTGERSFEMGSAAETQSRLIVMPSGDSQILVWMVDTVEYDKLGFAHGGSVIIDAISGEVLSTNPFN